MANVFIRSAIVWSGAWRGVGENVAKCLEPALSIRPISPAPWAQQHSARKEASENRMA